MERKIYYESTDNIKLCGLLNAVNNDFILINTQQGLIN